MLSPIFGFLVADIIGGLSVAYHKSVSERLLKLRTTGEAPAWRLDQGGL